MATITVSNTNDSGAGSLRQAILDANASDTITFANGISGGTITLTTGDMAIAKGLTIDGDLDNDGTADITISGNSASRIFDVSGSNTISLDGLTLTNGSDTQGGAIQAATGVTLNITNSTFSSNAATNNRGGGAIYSTNASSTTISITGSTFSNNTASTAGADGGHIASRSSGGSLTITDSAFSNGTAADIAGGVLTAGLNTVTVSGSSFTGSSAAAGGGAFLNGTTISVTGSTFSGNSATAGGGGLVISASGTATVNNVTISGNTANAYAGGLRVSGTVNVYSTTITNNRADNNDSSGGGHIGGGFQVAGGTTNLNNTVISGNFRGTGTVVDDVASTSTIATAKNSFFGGTATVTTNTNSTTASTTGDDAGLGTLASNGGNVQTHAISSSTSALVNAGDNSLIVSGTTTDAAGNTRTQGSTVDIGAFESSFAPVSSSSGGGSSGSSLSVTNQTAADTAGTATGRTLVNNTGSTATGDLVVNTGNGNVVTATLPSGVSLTTSGSSSAQSTSTASTTLTGEIQATEPDTGAQSFLDGHGQTFINGSGGVDLDIRSITFSGGGSTAQTVQLTGSGSSGSEAFVVDTSNLPTGSTLQLDNIEFAAIVGNATVTGGAGQNYVVGDDAIQFISLGAEDDTLAGGGGNDTIGSGFGEDLLYGNQGADSVFGGGGMDTLYGGQDGDTVLGNNDNDFVYGNKGDDTLSGGGSDDVLFGGQDNDIVYGNAGNDSLSGNLGDDTLYGGQGNDLISGGDGADLLFGNAGDDTLVGGNAADTFVFSFSGGNDQLNDFQAGTDTMALEAGLGVSGGTETNGNTTVTFSDGGTVTVVGVNKTYLAAATGWELG